ncbi:nuclear apoptosis-inducing factor 1-like [Epinephelus moara]|uniref:nuclear apoptosis-inducing factor 1-like n=1 Tax=Epinephelus moara TaxID=300413 RepID=UPI00214EBA22|nr:nuclear apoptosis-inducing factor 1-like [Epinephelus moara]
MEMQKSSKKRNFSDAEIETITSEVQRNKLVLSGSLKSGFKGSQKAAVWKEITAAVNSVGVDKGTPAEVKKNWSDLKIATKRRVAALKRSSTQTGGGQPDPSLALTQTAERVAALIWSPSNSGISGGGDTDAPPVAKPDNDEEPGTSAGPSAAQSGLEPAAQSQTTSYERAPVSSAPHAGPPP